MAKAVVDTVSLEADAESAKLLAEIGDGITVGALAEIAEPGQKKQGADVRVTLYHAFDGRIWEGPLYMTTGEGGAMSLFKYTFSEEQIKAVGADPKWIGKRVWYSEPQPIETINGTILCRFSVKRKPEEIEALRKDGFDVFCRKNVTFVSAAQEDFHVKMRHPKFYEFMEKKRAQDTLAETAQTNKVMVQALLQLLENQQPKEK